MQYCLTRIAENSDDLASDDNTISMDTNGLELFAVGDAESDGKR